VADKLAAEKAAAEKAAAEKAAAEKLAAEKAAAEKAAAEKAAAAKAAPAKPGWPVVGDRWVYEVRQSGKTFQTSVEVRTVYENTIVDFARLPNGGGRERAHSSILQLVGIAPGIAGFAPYLPAVHPMREGEKLNVLPSLWGCGQQATCDVSARIAGREQVTVKAGSYNAWKVEIQVQFNYIGGKPRVADFVYWYAPEAKRMVRYQYRLRSGWEWQHANTDSELLSYTPAGSK